jgi:hypothetical protein
MDRMRELSEADARGSIAKIYEEIREYYAAPYVSSLFRHLATYPGLLEWIWKITLPAFETGLMQNTGWKHVDVSGLKSLTPLSKEDLTSMKIDRVEKNIIIETCLTFTRVSPINLIFASCLEHLLLGKEIDRSIQKQDEFPLPSKLLLLPKMVPWEDMTKNELTVLNIFSTTLAGETFIPGIYRILARWPLYLRYVANELGPLLHDPVILNTCEKIADNIFCSAPEVFGALDFTDKKPPLKEAQKQQVLQAIAAYRGTSPQMLGFGTLLVNALSDDSSSN